MQNNVKKRIIESKKKIENRIEDTKNKIKSLDFDAHWYRRVFHTFGACFVIYYLVPENIDWMQFLKFWLPPILVIIALSLELLRIKGFLSSNHFFGLRYYEQKRLGSYVYFAVGALLLLIFFPQQIAIPCILCASLGDPIIGEARIRFNKKIAYLLGFIVCLFFFMIAFYKSNIILFIFASFIGATGALIGEIKKFTYIDDDFMIQILPAVLLGLIWISLPYLGLSEPDIIIHPLIWPW